MFNSYPDDGGWIFTNSKIKFYPMNPEIEKIFIHDIAHALSHICRYAGHSKYFYSVAQHSILIANYLKSIGASKNLQLAALLHDASEAYLVDIPKPVKHCFKGYAEAEDKIMSLVAKKYGLVDQDFIDMKKYDVAILLDEAKELLDADTNEWNINAEPLNIKIEPWLFEYTKHAFLEKFKELY